MTEGCCRPMKKGRRIASPARMGKGSAVQALQVVVPLPGAVIEISVPLPLTE